MQGTSIQDLNKESAGPYRQLQDIQQNQYNNMNNLQHELGHNAQHQMHQNQQIPYYGMASCLGYPQFDKIPDLTGNPRREGGDEEIIPGPTIRQPPPQMLSAIDIEDLARDINENLPEDTFSSLSERGEEKTSRQEGGGYLGFIPEILREPLLIIILFVILSQPLIKENLGKYITQINPDSEGVVSFAGVVVYAIIFAILFVILKKFLIE